MILEDLRLYLHRYISRSFRTKLTPEMICEKGMGQDLQTLQVDLVS
jgi:hypothetical protein